MLCPAQPRPHPPTRTKENHVAPCFPMHRSYRNLDLWLCVFLKHERRLGRISCKGRIARIGRQLKWRRERHPERRRGRFRWDDRQRWHGWGRERWLRLWRQPKRRLERGLWRQPKRRLERGLWRQPKRRLERGLWRQPKRRLERGLWRQPKRRLERGLWRQPKRRLERGLWRQPKRRLDCRLGRQQWWFGRYEREGRFKRQRRCLRRRRSWRWWQRIGHRWYLRGMHDHVDRHCREHTHR